MTKNYYLVPFDSIPTDVSIPVWFATWSTNQPTVEWSMTRPDVEPDGVSTWAVGITVNNPLDGATTLGTGSKDVPPPPGTTLTLSPTAAGISDFQKMFQQYLAARGM